MNKKMNIVIVGLGNIGSYFYNYLRKNKNIIFNKTNIVPNILYVSAKSFKKKRNFSIPKKIWLNNFLSATKNKNVDIIIELIGGAEGPAKRLVFEALENGPEDWLNIDINVLPGITAMLAASARAGAPLGHDFCAINLSDNLKPWSIIEKRLRLAAEADFAMAFYNPRSKSRPEGVERTLEILKDACGDDRPVIFARNVSRPDETIKIVPLSQTTPDMADMRTMVLVGSSQTRIIEREIGPIVYTPRSLAK